MNRRVVSLIIVVLLTLFLESSSSQASKCADAITVSKKVTTAIGLEINQPEVIKRVVGHVNYMHDLYKESPPKAKAKNRDGITVKIELPNGKTLKEERMNINGEVSDWTLRFLQQYKELKADIVNIDHEGVSHPAVRLLSSESAGDLPAEIHFIFHHGGPGTSNSGVHAMAAMIKFLSDNSVLELPKSATTDERKTFVSNVVQLLHGNIKFITKITDERVRSEFLNLIAPLLRDKNEISLVVKQMMIRKKEGKRKIRERKYKDGYDLEKDFIGQLVRLIKDFQKLGYEDLLKKGSTTYDIQNNPIIKGLHKLMEGIGMDVIATSNKKSGIVAELKRRGIYIPGSGEAIEQIGANLGARREYFNSMDDVIQYYIKYYKQVKAENPGKKVVAFARSAQATVLMAILPHLKGIVDVAILLSPTLPGGKPEEIERFYELFDSYVQDDLFISYNKETITWLWDTILQKNTWTERTFRDAGIPVAVFTGADDLEVAAHEVAAYDAFAAAVDSFHHFRIKGAGHDPFIQKSRTRDLPDITVDPAYTAFESLIRFLKEVLEIE